MDLTGGCCGLEMDGVVWFTARDYRDASTISMQAGIYHTSPRG